MTILDYLTNPAGKGSNVLGDSSSIKQKYADEAQNFISLGKGIPVLYQYKKRYLIFHYQLESKSGSKYGEGLHYDVLFEVDTKGFDDTKIHDMDFKVYSNCPSFLYTYANLFYRKNLIIDWTRRLYEKETIKKTAEVRNSYGIIGYERSLYITALLIQNAYGNMTCKDVMVLATPISTTNTILQKIQSQTQMKRSFATARDQYKKAQSMQGSTRKEKKKGEEFSDLSPESHLVKKTNTVKKTKTTKRSKKI